VVLTVLTGPTPTPSPVLLSGTVCPGANCNDTTVSPGVLGFGVFLLLALAVFVLIRSFRKQIAKVPPTFDPPDSDRVDPK